jgi:peroxiredoxin
MNTVKKNLLSAIALLILALSCTEKYSLSIDGTAEGIPSGKIYLQKFVNKMYFVIDSASIENGHFKFRRNVEIPEIYGLTLDTLQSPYMLFLDGNLATVAFDTARHYRNTKVEGSALQDLFVEYRKQKQVKIDEFIRAHPASLVSAYALYRDFSYRLSPDEIRADIALLDSSLYATQYVKTLENLAKTLDIVNTGKPAPDFTLNSPDGKPVKLSDKLGKGYLLVDFWASWCGPCRRENPNVVAVYRKYRDRGFDIIGVSLDRNGESWKAAIGQDSLSWTQVSDLKFWNSEAAQLYGVRAIPSNYLIDSNGIIVAKNLRGEDLDKLIGSYLDK